MKLLWIQKTLIEIRVAFELDFGDTFAARSSPSPRKTVGERNSDAETPERGHVATDALRAIHSIRELPQVESTTAVRNSYYRRSVVAGRNDRWGVVWAVRRVVEILAGRFEVVRKGRGRLLAE